MTTKLFKKVGSLALSAALLLGSVSGMGMGRVSAATTSADWQTMPTTTAAVVNTSGDGSNALMATYVSSNKYALSIYDRATNTYIPIGDSTKAKKNYMMSDSGRVAVWTQNNYVPSSAFFSEAYVVISVDGQAPLTISDIKASQSAPTVSPDGKKVAYASTNTNGYKIYDVDSKQTVDVPNVAGMTVYSSTTAPIPGYQASFDNTGNKLYFISKSATGSNYGLVAYDGTSTTLLKDIGTPNTGTLPLLSDVSLDNNYIAYTTSSGTPYTIYNLGSGTTTPTTTITYTKPRFLGNSYFASQVDGVIELFDYMEGRTYKMLPGQYSKDLSTFVGKSFKDGAVVTYTSPVHTINLSGYTFEDTTVKENFKGQFDVSVPSVEFAENIVVEINGTVVYDMKANIKKLPSSYVDTNGKLFLRTEYGMIRGGMNNVIKITFSNHQSSVTAQTTAVMPDKPATLGNKTGQIGDKVVFDQRTFMLVGDNTLMDLQVGSIKSWGSSTAFVPTATGSLAHYLNNEYLTYFNPEYAALIPKTAWNMQSFDRVNNKLVDPVKTVNAHVILPTVEIVKNLYRMYDAKPIASASYAYLTNTQIGNSDSVLVMDASSYSVSTPDRQYAFAPVFKIVPEANVTIGSDYVLTVGSEFAPAITKPDAPTGLKQNGTAGSIPVSLSWNAVPNASGYKLFRDGVMIGNPSMNMHTDLSATAGKTYAYTVSAIGNGTAAVGDSDLSQPLNVTTTKELVKPTGLKVDNDKKGAVQISWTAELGLTYKVYRNGVLVDTVANNQYVDTLGKVGDKVSYAIESTDGTVTSPKSDAVEVTIASAISLTAPQAVIVVSDEEGSVKISWQAVAGADGYNVYLDGQKVKQVTGLTYTNPDLVAGSIHELYVEADDNQGTVGPASETVSIAVKAKPPVEQPVVVPSPQSFRLLGKTTVSASLAWAKVEGATYKLTKNGETVYEGSNAAFNVTRLNPSTGYAMEVVAIKDGKESAPAVLDVVTNEEVVPYPLGLTVTEVTYKHVVLSWNPVAGADGYVITRNGEEIDTVQGNSFEDLSPVNGAANYYGVSATKGNLISKEARKSVYVPVETGSAPDAPVGLKATRIHHDSVALEWPYIPTASEYQVFRDDNTLVYKGPLTSIVDTTVTAQTSYLYKVIAVNANGKAESQPIGVTTAAEPQPIPVYPAEPQSGKIAFEFATVIGAYMYGVDRNPQVTYMDNGNGTFTKWYFNTVTEETENQGIVTPTADGRLPFSEDNVIPGQDYTYKITAYKLGANGASEEIADNEATVTAPTDGTGGTVTAPTTPTTPTTPTNPGTTPTTPVDPGTGTETPTTPANPGTTAPTTPGTGATVPTTPETGTTPVNPGTTAPTTPANPETGTTPIDPATPTAPSFSDVPAGNYAYEAVSELALRGVVTGYTDGSFGVNKDITRAEFAIMTKRALGYMDGKESSKKFTDLSPNAWYAKELATAINKGITKGFSNGTYHPNDLIPREQAAVMISNVLRDNSIKQVDGFTAPDMYKVIAWAKADMTYIGGLGIIKGDTSGKIYPKSNMTRGEAAVMIHRMLKMIEGK